MPFFVVDDDAAARSSALTALEADVAVLRDSTGIDAAAVVLHRAARLLESVTSEEDVRDVALVVLRRLGRVAEGLQLLYPGSESTREATSSVSGDGDEATEEVHPADGRSDSCRPCGAGCGAGLASRSCASPAHPTPTTGEDAVVVLDAAPFTVRLLADDGDVFANVEADNDAMTDPRELARILRGLADRLDG